MDDNTDLYAFKVPANLKGLKLILAFSTVIINYINGNIKLLI
ncbi:hypothetical protein P872_14705 [Rhodonellum psychrophilum GCM71 = DSM 17998]|uniref:Uncharacterized protein n=1 Tax=Rhodonellum psychrophilum GCM71 = DSM 17998 TaxID=1123057 RepID=U5C2K8_9BACT|nr:hypothetical protein P872_14705 [Rhodonellum psychrophilum GCM71 = DSM 17998]